MKRQLAVFLAACMTASLVAGCSSSSSTEEAVTSGSGEQPASEQKEDAGSASANGNGETIQLRAAWWGNQERTDNTIAVFDQFGEDNGVSFTYEYNSYDSYWETLATQSVGNNMPDIIQQVTDQFAGYINNGLLVDLTPYVESGALDLSDCEESYISGGRYNDGLYGVSLGTNVMTIIYNPDLFEAAGVEVPSLDWTWSDFTAAARTIYEKTGVQSENVALGMPRYLLEPMIRSKGQALYTEDGKNFGFDDEVKEQIIGVIQDCYDLVQEGVFVDPEEQLLWQDNSERAICKGEAAMAMNWSSVFTTFCNYYDVELEMATQPLFDDAQTQGMYLRPAQFFSVTKDCENPEMAARAISYFINDSEANQILKGERGIPAATAIRNEMKESVNETEQKVYDFMDTVLEYCRDADPAEPSASRQCVEILNNNVTEVMYGQMTAQECIDDWMAQSVEIFSLCRGWQDFWLLR